MRHLAGGDRALTPSFLLSQATLRFLPEHDAIMGAAACPVETVGGQFKTGEARWALFKRAQDDKSQKDNGFTKHARASSNPFAPRSVRRALLTPQINPGSLYRCGRSI